MMEIKKNHKYIILISGYEIVTVFKDISCCDKNIFELFPLNVLWCFLGT
jgi:hypothetical protein